MSKYSRQLKDLQIRCDSLISRKRNAFSGFNYQELKEFGSFYDHTVSQLRTEYSQEPLIMERLNYLPRIDIREDDRLFTLRNWFKTLIYSLFTPLLLLFYIDRMIYEQGIKANLIKSKNIFSSIATLTQFD